MSSAISPVKYSLMTGSAEFFAAANLNRLVVNDDLRRLQSSNLTCDSSRGVSQVGLVQIQIAVGNLVNYPW